MNSVHGSEIFKCTVCDFKTKTKRALTVHTGLYHKEKKFFCKYCDFKAGYQHRLNLHIRRTHGKDMTENERMKMNLFQCSICKYTSTSEKIKVHRQTHENKQMKQVNKAFKCDICHFSSDSEKRITYHKNDKHSGMTSKKCYVCSYESGYQKNIDIHIENVHVESIYI